MKQLPPLGRHLTCADLRTGCYSPSFFKGTYSYVNYVVPKVFLLAFPLSRFASRSVATFAGLGVLMAVGSSAPAQALVITPGVTIDSGGVNLAAPARTFGYEFNLINPATINALGSYDLNGDGLGGSYTVGLWDDVGTLLSSAIVGTSDPLVSSFRWASIAPITLGPGNYIVGSGGGWFTNGDRVWGSFNGGSFTTNELTVVSGRQTASPGFGFPTNFLAFTALGGNVSFAPTPVPAPLPLLGVGAAFAYSRTLRKRIKTSKTPEVVSTII